MEKTSFGAVALAVVLLACAPEAPAEVRLGGVAGANFASMSTDDPSALEIGTQMRFGLGGVAEIGLGDRLSLVTEPMWLGKGATTDISEAGVAARARLKLSYVELPLLVKYALGESDGVRPYLLAGPTVGFKTGAKAAAEIDGLDVEVDGGEEDISEEVKGTDLGLAFGGGVSAPLGSGRAFAEAQYVIGLTDIDKEEDFSTKNKGLQIRIGVTFPIGAR